MSFSDATATGMFVHSRPVVECVHCGAHLYVPEWSKYVGPGRIRHLWQCEDCGCSFETVTQFEAA